MFFNVIPTHSLGMWLLDTIDAFLDKLGLSHEQTVETVIYIALISCVAVLLGWIARRVILFITQKFVALRRTDVGDELIKQNVFTKCSHIIPPLVFLGMVPLAFETDQRTLNIIEDVVLVYFLITLGIAINAILTFIWVHFDSHDNTNKHPLRGLLNTGHGIVWIIIAITALSILMDKSPMTLLAGLGAFAAALMLIFKDSILGLVAGIQLSQNDMLRVGDWIVVPSTPANGTVEDVTLTVVKVRNWDNTLIMLPPYTLVSTSFQNWRGMFDAGGREIARFVYIDNSSITATDDALIDSIVARFPMMKQYVDGMRKQIADGKGNTYSTDVSAVNGSLETNLGLYRAYLCMYLRNHPQIHTDAYLMVRLQASDGYGTPLQIFCYSKITKWVGYEAVQSEIFEHVAATAPLFGLKIYNAPDRNSFEITNGQQALSETGGTSVQPNGAAGTTGSSQAS